jgi:hypothetical protein
VRRGGKARGHFDTAGQLRNHLAQAGVFTANRLDIAHPELFEGDDQGGRAEELRHGEAPLKLNNRLSACLTTVPWVFLLWGIGPNRGFEINPLL